MTTIMLHQFTCPIHVLRNNQMTLKTAVKSLLNLTLVGMSIAKMYNTLHLVADWLKPGTKQGVINADIIGLGAAGYVLYGSAIIGFRENASCFWGRTQSSDTVENRIILATSKFLLVSLET